MESIQYKIWGYLFFQFRRFNFFIMEVRGFRADSAIRVYLQTYINTDVHVCIKVFFSCTGCYIILFFVFFLKLWSTIENTMKLWKDWQVKFFGYFLCLQARNLCMQCLIGMFGASCRVISIILEQRTSINSRNIAF